MTTSACVKPLEVSSITEIQSKTGSKSIDVYEPRRARDQPGLPEFAGDQLVEVRSYVLEDGKGQVEISGADCQISAADFTASAVTPAKVRVPLYRGQSSTLGVSCEKPGFRKHSITLAAVDTTRQGRYSSGSSAGVIGLVAAVAVDGMSDNTKNEWRYPVAKMMLEPTSQQQ